MTAEEIKDIVRCGETSTVQFKLLFNKVEDIANELIAFSNSNGGRIFIGINDKTGAIEGLSYKQLQDIGSLVASAADVGVHPSVFPEVDSKIVDGKSVMIVTVKRGLATPYTNKIWREAKEDCEDVNINGEKIGKKVDGESGIGKKIGKKIDVKSEIGKKIGKKDDLLLTLVLDNPKISISQLATASGMASSTVQVYLDKLRSEGKVRRVGPDKGGHWEVL